MSPPPGAPRTVPGRTRIRTLIRTLEQPLTRQTRRKQPPARPLRRRSSIGSRRPRPSSAPNAGCRSLRTRPSPPRGRTTSSISARRNVTSPGSRRIARTRPTRVTPVRRIRRRPDPGPTDHHVDDATGRWQACVLRHRRPPAAGGSRLRPLEPPLLYRRASVEAQRRRPPVSASSLRSGCRWPPGRPAAAPGSRRRRASGARRRWLRSPPAGPARR